jgi:hypothetical protein
VDDADDVAAIYASSWEDIGAGRRTGDAHDAATISGNRDTSGVANSVVGVVVATHDDAVGGDATAVDCGAATAGWRL